MDGTDGYHDTHGCILEFWRRQIGTILKKWRRESAIARLSRLMISLSSRENSRHMIWFAFPDGGWTVSVALLVYTFESQSSKWESIKHHHQISLSFFFFCSYSSIPSITHFPPFPFHTHIYFTPCLPKLWSSCSASSLAPVSCSSRSSLYVRWISAHPCALVTHVHALWHAATLSISLTHLFGLSNGLL